MTDYLSAGVYLKEEDKSTYVQTSTSLRPGMVIRAPWGPSNVIKELTTVRDLFDMYGIPDNGNYIGLLSAKQYLNGYSNNIKLIRVVSSGDLKADVTLLATAAPSLVVEALYVGSGGNKLSITIETDGAKKKLSVYLDGELKEVYTGLEKAAGVDKNANYKAAINGISDYIVIATDATADAETDEPDNISLAPLTGGTDSLPSKNELIGATPDDSLQLFRPDTVYINRLLCPDAAKLSLDADVADVGKELIAIVEERKDCVALVDIPEGKSVSEAITFKSTTAAYNSSYSSVYWSWVTINEATVDADVKFPGSTIGLLVAAKSIGLSYSWFAAAGYNRGIITNAKDVEFNPDLGSRELLTEAQINPILNETGVGVVVLGNKTTLVTPSALQSLNIRDLLLTSKKLIASVSKTLIMEPNDVITEEKFIATTNQILANIAAKRGLDDLRVVSDTTDLDRENNRQVFHIKLKPTRTAEIIVVSFQILNANASFDD